MFMNEWKILLTMANDKSFLELKYWISTLTYMLDISVLQNKLKQYHLYDMPLNSEQVFRHPTQPINNAESSTQHV